MHGNLKPGLIISDERGITGISLMRLTDDSDNRRLSVCLSITLSIRHGDIQGQIKRNGVLDITNKIMMDGGELYCMPDGRTTLKGKWIQSSRAPCSWTQKLSGCILWGTNTGWRHISSRSAERMSIFFSSGGAEGVGILLKSNSGSVSETRSEVGLSLTFWVICELKIENKIRHFENERWKIFLCGFRGHWLPGLYDDGARGSNSRIRWHGMMREYTPFTRLEFVSHRHNDSITCRRVQGEYMSEKEYLRVEIKWSSLSISYVLQNFYHWTNDI